MSDREAPPEEYAEYFHGVSEEVGLAVQMLRDLSAYTSPEHMRELRDTFAGALAAVDREAKEACAALCDEAADEADKYPIAIVRDGARALADAIRDTIR